MKAYYEHRAPEYDDWYLGEGAFSARERPAWREELEALAGALRALPAARTLDVACGTGFLTQHLRGPIVGLDASETMLSIAGARLPHARLVVGDALALPFGERSFERVFTGHFYGHLEDEQRAVFLTEARRVATELVVVDSALRPDVEPEGVEERAVRDGSRYEVYKRYFTPGGLSSELGGGRTLHDGRWFVAVAA